MIEIFAHRGASREAPDNSPEAIQKALEIGVDGIEIDCLIRPDGIPVVAHDTILPETAPLKEILALIRPTRAKVILDIKKQKGWLKKGPPLIAKEALEILPPDQILASSFSLRTLEILRKQYPKLSLGFITGSTAFKLVPPQIFGKLLPVRSIHPCLGGLKRGWIEKWQRRGFKVYTWVANSEVEFKKCQELGVNGFFTDDPRLAKKVLKHG